jgi:hypothetical protein
MRACDATTCASAAPSLQSQNTNVAFSRLGWVDGMSAEQIANVKLKKAAEVIVFIFNADRARTEHGLELLWPFANALIWELLTIVS